MGKHLENYRKFIKVERIRTYHDGVEIFYANDVEDMLAAMAEALVTNSKEPETVHGNEAEKVVNGETYYCRFCDAKFTDEYDLEAHVKFHH